MKIVKVVTLISRGEFPRSNYWREVRLFLHRQITEIDHPAGSGKFTIYPESGKETGKGNGVGPIKRSLIDRLYRNGWEIEKALDIATRKNPGKLDAVLCSTQGNVVVEWETGNISSSHRALNKMCIGLMRGVIAAAVLVVPSRDMYKYLTDRVGNLPELEPYFDLWKSIKCDNGVLEIVVIEQDAESYDVPRIKKGTDGRALV